MKQFYLLFVMIFILGSSQAQTSADQKEISWAPISSCDTSYKKLLAIAVSRWKNEYEFVRKIRYPDLYLDTITTDTLYRDFDPQLVDDLFTSNPSSTDSISAFFIVENPDHPFPNLALVSLDAEGNPILDGDNAILVSTSNGGKFIGSQDFINGIENWADYCQNSQHPNFYAEIDSYTMYVCTIETAMNSLKQDNGGELQLRLGLGVKGVSADEYNFYQVFDENYEGYFVYEIVITNSSSIIYSENPVFTFQDIYYDFSKPCPKICGSQGKN